MREELKDSFQARLHQGKTPLEIATEFGMIEPFVRKVHDTPRDPGNIYTWLEHKVQHGILKGLILPTAPQQDVDKVYPGDNKQYRPNLGVFMRP